MTERQLSLNQPWNMPGKWLRMGNESHNSIPIRPRFLFSKICNHRVDRHIHIPQFLTIHNQAQDVNLSLIYIWNFLKLF